MKAYYERRAREYDDWYQGLGRFDGLTREHWDRDLHELERTLSALPPARTLDVACGTGFLTRHLRGSIVGLDQSAQMLEIARERVPDAEFILGNALALPFDEGSFERVFTGHFYGHLEELDREPFLGECRRVARELVVVDASRRHNRPSEEWQERLLDDGSRWRVFKRYFTPEELAGELGEGKMLAANRWFIAVVSNVPREPVTKAPPMDSPDRRSGSHRDRV